MKKLLVVLGAGCVLWVVGQVVGFGGEVRWQDVSGGNTDIRSVLAYSDKKGFILMGTRNTVFRSVDSGKSWRNVLLVRGNDPSINFLYFDPQVADYIYAATGNGLYVSSNQGQNWKRIFKGRNAFANDCTGLAVGSSGIYLGTKNGLFVSKDKGRSWAKEPGKLGDNHILAISANPKDPDDIYVACTEGVFRSKNKGASWDRVVVASATENGGDEQEENDDRDDEEKYSNIRYLGIDPDNANVIYLATSMGVQRSDDKGDSWKPVADYGLLSKDVKFLSVSKAGKVYALTRSGIFEFANGRWQELSFDLAVNSVRSLSIDTKGDLFAACDKGLFKLSTVDLGFASKKDWVEVYSRREPKINEVQQAAIKYAEVEPEKIQQWRTKAAKKALLPRLSIGIDRNTTDLWHWEGGSTTKSEDDVLRKGNDSVDWDVSLSWELGELIWNNDQTSIDTRSRLMVQLRDDILDEVTKLYFERLRQKAEFDNLPIEDRRKRFEKGLRIEELTASIDALTGGYFSRQL
ncbi:MAG: hypothetical protein KJ880_07065 [Candidatus Omnitrophica bacterium]|nr:hypothetical protein [Candidatus Omnitrophota bacterium]